MIQPVLKTQWLILRPVEASDQQKVFEGFSHPLIIKHLEISYPTFEATTQQMEWYFSNLQTGTGYAWAVTDKEHATSFLGVFSLYYINAKHKRAELGYWLFPEYWNKGYTTEGCGAILDFVSGTLNLHRIAAEVEPNNTASRNVLIRLGFEKEAVLRDYEYHNGKFQDLEIWAKIF